MDINRILSENREYIRQELTCHLQNLIRIDTRTALGREIEAARYLKSRLDQAGIDAAIFEPAAGKGSVIAFLPGSSSSLPPLLLLSHLDTADWQEGDWSYPPLSGQFRQGYIWGRGAIDCKGLAILWLVICRLIKKSGITPLRTILFAATADEESGGRWGVQWLLDHTSLLKNIGYVLSEGGGWAVKFGKRQFFTCQTGEKGLMQVEAGQGAKIQKRLGKEIRHTHSPSIDMLAENVLSGQPGFYRLLSRPPLFREKILSWLQCRERVKINIPELFRPVTVSPGASSASSVLLRISPAVDERLLLNLSPQLVHDGIFEPPMESSLHTELFHLMQRVVREQDPSYTLLPYITPGYSDNRFFRKLGIPTYGFFPLEDGSAITRIHQANERVYLPALEKSFRMLFSLIIRTVLSPSIK